MTTLKGLSTLPFYAKDLAPLAEVILILSKDNFVLNSTNQLVREEKLETLSFLICKEQVSDVIKDFQSLSNKLEAAEIKKSLDINTISE